MNHYTTKEVARLTGMKPNTLHYYIQAEAVGTKDPGSGRGTSRVLSDKNLLEAAILKELIRYAMPKKFIVPALQGLRISTDWKGFDPMEVMKNQKTILIVFYPEGKTVAHDIISVTPRVHDSRKINEIPDAEFFEALANPVESHVNLTITRPGLFIVVNLSMISWRFSRVLV